MSVTSSGSQAILRGYLDPNHTSDLSAYWINRPTPWPFVLASVSLSIILGFIGVQSSYKSWDSNTKDFDTSGSNIALSSPPVNPTAYQPLRPSSFQSHHRRYSSASATTYARIIENNAMDTYFADRRPSSASSHSLNTH